MYTVAHCHACTHTLRLAGGGQRRMEGVMKERMKKKREYWAPRVSAAASLLPAPRNELQLSVYFISGFSSSCRAWLEEATWESLEFVGYKSLAKAAEMRWGQRCEQGAATDKRVPLTLDKLIGTASRLWWLDNYMQPRCCRAGSGGLVVQLRKQEIGRWCQHCSLLLSFFFSSIPSFIHLLAVIFLMVNCSLLSLQTHTFPLPLQSLYLSAYVAHIN